MIEGRWIGAEMGSFLTTEMDTVFVLFCHLFLLFVRRHVLSFSFRSFIVSLFLFLLRLSSSFLLLVDLFDWRFSSSF